MKYWRNLVWERNEKSPHHSDKKQWLKINMDKKPSAIGKLCPQTDLYYRFAFCACHAPSRSTSRIHSWCE